MVKRQALEKLFSFFFITEKKNFSHYSITEHNIYGMILFICATSNDFFPCCVVCDSNVCLWHVASSMNVRKKFKFRVTKSGCVFAVNHMLYNTRRWFCVLEKCAAFNLVYAFSYIFLICVAQKSGACSKQHEVGDVKFSGDIQWVEVKASTREKSTGKVTSSSLHWKSYFSIT